VKKGKGVWVIGKSRTDLCIAYLSELFLNEAPYFGFWLLVYTKCSAQVINSLSKDETGFILMLWIQH